MKYLTLEELLAIATAVNGGHAAVRDAGLLAASVERPRTTVFGHEAYPRLIDKAAALLHATARNRALVDGNKRTAFLAAAIMLRINGEHVKAFPEAQEKAMNAIAQGDMEVPEIAELLEEWTK
ncbi:type II toxin-antitoxin system death-on-curing family toxin [Nocardia sp. NPDC051463]|uniref:type II toxin-antitoxin system death-on-curing family toxin n=1 Tax=Nocardia sp. NPDC051463 TaxID=3154845 RepID=UPI00344B9289